MPRKTKEIDVENEEKKNVKTTKAKSTAKKNTTTTAKKETKSTNTKKAPVVKKTTSKKETKSSTTKKVANKKETKSATAKKVANKKETNSATAKKMTKVSSKKNLVKKQIITEFSPEYYDLPYRYNQTVVKILAQTPNNLFIYWDISDEDRQNLKNQYGEYFFEITKPVLIVYNETLNYSFEVDINDFANSWYLHIDDSDCEYKIELGRRPIPINYNYIPEYNIEENGPIKPVENSYIYISSSNKIVSPNDKILFNLRDKIYFRNVKTNEVTARDIKEFPSIFEKTKFVDIYKLYKDLFNDEILSNPSSGNPSSGSRKG